MSIIGKRVKFKEYAGNTESIEGTIIEKYIGLTTIKQEFPSGRGGSVSISNHLMNIDKYMIEQTKNKHLIHINASNIFEILY